MESIKINKLEIRNVVCVSADEFERMCRVDARMDALISYISCIEDSIKKGYPQKSISLNPLKAIIGMCDE